MTTRAQLCSLLYVLISIIGTLDAHGDDFYEQRLREGTAAYAAGRVAEAIEEFRIASFGLADRPALLGETLARLAMAHDANSKTGSDRDAVIARFLDLERGSAFWSSTTVDAALHTAFEALLARHVSAGILREIPSLARLASAEIVAPDRREAAVSVPNEQEPVVEDLPLHAEPTVTLPAASPEAAPVPDLIEKEVEKAVEAAVETEKITAVQTRLPHSMTSAAPLLLPAAGSVPPVIEPQVSVERPTPAVVVAAPAIAIEPQVSAVTLGPAPVTIVLPAQPDPNANMLARTSALLRGNRVREAFKLIDAAVLAAPANRQLRLAHLEVSVRSGSWDLAMEDLGALRVLKTGEESSMDYAAIALFESGYHDLARHYALRSGDVLASNAWIEGYRRKIFASPH